MSLSPAFLDELRARTTLSTLIGRTVKVTKAGREYKACCPFHNEKTPSFTINDEKGFYHCFGCGAHGDAIRWMTDQRGLPFMDAVKELADAAGMELPAPDPRAAKKAEAARGLHDVMAAAQSWFVDQLAGIDGAEARAYLDNRGISPATRQAFGFGFAPDSRGRLKGALKDFPPDMLVETGMLIQPDDRNRESYDRFRGRLMIPIRDARGRVIAFGGRILAQGEPKYLNSPDTPLFDKGRTLYNLDKAAPAARKSGRMIVVEGYMDVIALAQAGFTECVAPLGTALTEHQIERLWSMVDCPVLCFDGDAAGQRAAIRAAMRALPLLRPGHSLSFATLPSGQDPDDVVRSGGSAAFASILDQARPLIDMLWTHEVESGPLDTPEQRAGLKQRLAALTGAMQDGDVRAHYVHLLRERHDALFFSRPQRSPGMQSRAGGASSPRGMQRGGRWQMPPPPPTEEARALRQSGIDPTILSSVIAGLLRYPTEISRHSEMLYRLPPTDGTASRLLQAMLRSAADKEIVETEALLTILAESDLYNMAKELLRADRLHFTFTRNSSDLERARSDLAQAVRAMVEMPEIEAELVEVTRAMGDNPDDASMARQAALRRLRSELDMRLAEMAQPDDMA